MFRDYVLSSYALTCALLKHLGLPQESWLDRASQAGVKLDAVAIDHQSISRG